MGTDSAMSDPSTAPRVVVAALPLSKKARAALQAMLGPDHEVVDIRDSVIAADLVVCPACSPQTIAGLKDAFPTATLMVAELEDWDHHIELGGPVTRSREAGADAYVAASSLGALADLIRASAPDDATAIDAAAEAATPRELQASSIDDLISQELQAALLRRAEQPR